MSLRVSTNLPSINAQRHLAKSQNEIGKSMGQLASGSRITKASDDAAGLALSENLKSQIRGFRQAKRNAEDGMSLVQVAEGGLNEISNILTRLRELGVQAASDTVGETERTFLNKEVIQLKEEAERIARSTRFGSRNLLDGTSGQIDLQVGVQNNEFTDRLSIDTVDIDATNSNLGIDGLDFSTKDGAREALDVLDSSQLQVNGYRANLGAFQSRLISTQSNLGITDENLSAANSRIRDADIAMSSAELSKNNILLNATTSVLAQANAQPAQALKLFA